jgi:hypothetical protein
MSESISSVKQSNEFFKGRPALLLGGFVLFLHFLRTSPQKFDDGCIQQNSQLGNSDGGGAAAKIFVTGRRRLASYRKYCGLTLRISRVV